MSMNDHFEQVYKEFFDSLFGYALVITKSETLAKDAVSDVFYELLKSKKDLSSIKYIKSYLFVSVKNQAIRLSASDSIIHTQIHEHGIRFIDEINPEDLLIGKELDEFLDKSVSKLSPQCALVFRLVKEQKYKYGEVAAEVGISVDTVKYHLKNAVRKIRADFSDYFNDPHFNNWVSVGIITFTIYQYLLLSFC